MGGQTREARSGPALVQPAPARPLASPGGGRSALWRFPRRFLARNPAETFLSPTAGVSLVSCQVGSRPADAPNGAGMTRDDMARDVTTAGRRHAKKRTTKTTSVGRTGARFPSAQVLEKAENATPDDDPASPPAAASTNAPRPDLPSQRFATSDRLAAGEYPPAWDAPPTDDWPHPADSASSSAGRSYAFDPTSSTDRRSAADTGWPHRASAGAGDDWTRAPIASTGDSLRAARPSAVSAAGSVSAADPAAGWAGAAGPAAASAGWVGAADPNAASTTGSARAVDPAAASAPRWVGAVGPAATSAAGSVRAARPSAASAAGAASADNPAAEYAAGWVGAAGPAAASAIGSVRAGDHAAGSAAASVHAVEPAAPFAAEWSHAGDSAGPGYPASRRAPAPAPPAASSTSASDVVASASSAAVGDDESDGEPSGPIGARFGPYSARKPKRAKEIDTGSTPVVVDERPPTPPGEPTPEQSAERTVQLVMPWAGALVRPYAHTGGRTRSSQDLALEALVSTSDQPGHVTVDEVLTSQHRRLIVDLCAQPRSVAEVAALLSVPLGVARVLLGDLATAGVVVVHPTAGSTGDGEPDLEFMRRVLVGLRRL
jgi:Protein of unknown function (DUF742)